MKKNKKFVNRWESDAFESHEVAKKIYLDVKKNLKYSPHPISGWRSNPDQKLETIQTNQNGLRSQDLETIDKNLECCMLLGGSVAWGFGASCNDNIISYQIEKILMEKYKKKINIINFAEQMHSSHEELMTFVGYLDEIKPKTVICFSGTNDINRGYKNAFKFTDLNTAWINFFNKGNSIGIVNEKNIIKFITKTILRFFRKFKKIENKNLIFNKPEKNEIPIYLFQNKVEIMNSICRSKKISLLHILQPDLVLKKNKKLSEIDYYEFLDKSRIEYVNKHTLILKEYLKSCEINEKSDYIKYLDLTEIFDETHDVVYIDKAHVNNKGYKILSERISNELQKQFF